MSLPMSKKERKVMKNSGKKVMVQFDEQSFELTLKSNSQFGDVSTHFNLNKFKGYFSNHFLSKIGDFFEYRSESGISISSIQSEGHHFLGLLKKTINAGLIEKSANLEAITQIYLDCLYLIETEITVRELEILSLIFNTKFPGIFEKSVTKSAIPRKSDPLGHLGRRIKSIMKQSYSPATLACIMVFLENCYEEKRITLGQWAFFNLMLNTRVRIGSVRMMSVADIVHDEVKDEYYAYILPQKQNVDSPQKSTFLLTRSVGRILRKQRLEVLNSNNSKNIKLDNQHKIALFPSSKFQNHLIRNDNDLGFYESLNSFQKKYQEPINNLLEENKVYTNVFRHSVGSHLASNGMSSKTIQAVLRHVGKRTCQAYVELHLNGNLDKLSNALEPAFDKYFPVFKEFLSTKDTYDPKKVIISDNLDNGEIVKEGLCGSDMRCFSAPFSCYSCKKFTPFYDADHEVNLYIIESKINKFESQGHAFLDAIQSLKITKAFINLTIEACNSFKRNVQ